MNSSHPLPQHGKLLGNGWFGRVYEGVPPTTVLKVVHSHHCHLGVARSYVESEVYALEIVKSLGISAPAVLAHYVAHEEPIAQWPTFEERPLAGWIHMTRMPGVTKTGTELNENQIDILVGEIAKFHKITKISAFAEQFDSRRTLGSFRDQEFEVIYRDGNLQQQELGRKLQALRDEEYFQYQVLVHGDLHLQNILWNGNDMTLLDYPCMWWCDPASDFWDYPSAPEFYKKFVEKMKVRVDNPAYAQAVRMERIAIYVAIDALYSLIIGNWSNIDQRRYLDWALEKLNMETLI